jgi:4'-phosphopantetheinyl transferase
VKEKIPTTWGEPRSCGGTIDRTTVDVWQISLGQPADVQQALMKSLSADEIQRAQRYVFAIHRERFVVARGGLRMILGHYLDLPPAEIRFEYSQRGKPAVIPPSEKTLPLRFNLSHSNELALCAVTMDREVGIDLEALRPIVDADRMAARYFDPLENSSYQQLRASEKLDGFFRRWTMKEAYIKARGHGLSLALDQFRISTEPGVDGFHRVRSTDVQDDRRWAVKPLNAPLGYVASIVSEGDDWQLTYRQWPDDLR